MAVFLDDENCSVGFDKHLLPTSTDEPRDPNGILQRCPPDIKPSWKALRTDLLQEARPPGLADQTSAYLLPKTRSLRPFCSLKSLFIPAAVQIAATH
jgi:hypothetical protein